MCGGSAPAAAHRAQEPWKSAKVEKVMMTKVDIDGKTKLYRVKFELLEACCCCCGHAVLTRVQAAKNRWATRAQLMEAFNFDPEAEAPPAKRKPVPAPAVEEPAEDSGTRRSSRKKQAPGTSCGRRTGCDAVQTASRPRPRRARPARRLQRSRRPSTCRRCPA